METIDYGETDLHSIIEGDRRYEPDSESYGAHGFSQQEFEGEELVDVEEFAEPEDMDFADMFEEE
jgi:DNA-directed RNA polymerase subunit beta